MKWIIAAGSRCSNYKLFAHHMNLSIKMNDTIIVVRGTGAELLAVRYSKEHRVQLIIVPNHNVAIDKYNANACIQFDGGKTTRRIVTKARKSGLPVLQVS